MTDSTQRAILGGFIILGFFATVGAVLLLPIRTESRDIALVLLGALIASYKDVTSFLFGTTAGSVKKDETIAAQAAAVAAVAPAALPLGAGPTGTPADPVSVEVAPGDASAKVLGTLASLRDKT